MYKASLIGGAFFGILRAGLGKGGKAMKAALRPLGEKRFILKRAGILV